MEKLTLPPGVTHRHEPDVDIVAWSMTKKNLAWGDLPLFIAGSAVVIGALLFFTHKLFSNEMSDKSLGEWAGVLVFYGFVWFMVVGVLAALQSVTWTEEIQISDTDIVIMRSGNHAPKKSLRLHKNVVFALALDKLGSVRDSPGLCIFYRNRGDIPHEDFETLAIWMRNENKHQLLQLLQQILDRRGWRIAYRINERIEMTTRSPIPNIPPENKSVVFSQESIDFVVNELRVMRNRNHIIAALCQRIGCRWDEASALVSRVESATVTTDSANPTGGA